MLSLCACIQQQRQFAIFSKIACYLHRGHHKSNSQMMCPMPARSCSR